MTGYLLPLLSIVALCAAWAVFQQWLSAHDPDARRRSLKCGSCSRKDDCGDRQDQTQGDDDTGAAPDRRPLARH